MKFFLLLIYISYRENLPKQALMFWGIFSIFLFLSSLLWPYREHSSNLTQLICNLPLFVDVTFGMLTGVKVKSTLFVATTQAIWLVTLNGIGFLVLLSFLIFLFTFTKQGNEWTTIETMRRVYKHHGNRVFKWVNVMRESREMIDEVMLSTPLFAPILKIENQMTRVWLCWKDAKATLSIMEIPLREMLDLLANTHYRYRGISYVKKNMRIENAVGDMMACFARRHKAQLFMNPAKRRILLKLLAIRAFVGNRRLECIFDEVVKEDTKSSEGPIKLKNLDEIVSTSQLEGTIDQLEELDHQISKDLYEETISKLCTFLLTPPFTPHHKPYSIRLSKILRRRIKGWEHSFQLATGHAPSIEQKMERKEWYEQYRELKQKIEVL